MNDGMVLFYVKDDEVFPIAMTDENRQMLQAVMPIIFGNDPIRVIKDKSQGTIEWLK